MSYQEVKRFIEVADIVHKSTELFNSILTKNGFALFGDVSNPMIMEFAVNEGECITTGRRMFTSGIKSNQQLSKVATKGSRVVGICSPTSAITRVKLSNSSDSIYLPFCRTEALPNEGLLSVSDAPFITSEGERGISMCKLRVRNVIQKYIVEILSITKEDEELYEKGVNILNIIKKERDAHKFLLGHNDYTKNLENFPNCLEWYQAISDMCHQLEDVSILKRVMEGENPSYSLMLLEKVSYIKEFAELDKEDYFAGVE